jgi:hypothetical protein
MEKYVGENADSRFFEAWQGKRNILSGLLSTAAMDRPNLKRPVKRRRALLRSNLPRDSWVRVGRMSRLASVELMFCQGFVFELKNHKPAKPFFLPCHAWKNLSRARAEHKWQPTYSSEEPNLNATRTTQPSAVLVLDRHAVSINRVSLVRAIRRAGQ